MDHPGRRKHAKTALSQEIYAETSPGRETVRCTRDPAQTENGRPAASNLILLLQHRPRPLKLQLYYYTTVYKVQTHPHLASMSQTIFLITHRKRFFVAVKFAATKIDTHFPRGKKRREERERERERREERREKRIDWPTNHDQSNMTNRTLRGAHVPSKNQTLKKKKKKKKKKSGCWNRRGFCRVLGPVSLGAANGLLHHRCASSSFPSAISNIKHFNVAEACAFSSWVYRGISARQKYWRFLKGPVNFPITPRTPEYATEFAVKICWPKFLNSTAWIDAPTCWPKPSHSVNRRPLRELPKCRGPRPWTA